VQREKLRGMRLVPRRRRRHAAAHGGAQQDASNLQARIDLAWACLQRDNPVDAGRWLAEVLRVDPEHGQALLVRAELLRRARRTRRRSTAGSAASPAAPTTSIRASPAAARCSPPRASTVRSTMWQRAKACWPACTEGDSAPELLLARVYRDRGDRTQAQMEMKAYCRRSARAFTPRYTLAEFEKESGNRAEEARFLVECNRIDPFHRELHVRLGEAYEELGKLAEAALEYEVAAAVSPAFDRRTWRAARRGRTVDAPEELAATRPVVVAGGHPAAPVGDTERAVGLLERIGREAEGIGGARRGEPLLQEWRAQVTSPSVGSPTCAPDRG
jgi:tetratricopeptide (TPR) repeat protein